MFRQTSGAESEMKRFYEDSQFLHSNYETLREKHPDQWVAVFNKEVVATSRSLDDLLTDLDSQGRVSSGVVFEKMSSESQNLTLSQLWRRPRPFIRKAAMTEEKKASLRRFTEDNVFIGKHYAEWQDEYPGQYVAVFHKEVVGTDRDLDALLTDLKSRGLPLRKIAVERIQPKHPSWVPPALK